MSLEQKVNCMLSSQVENTFRYLGMNLDGSAKDSLQLFPDILLNMRIITRTVFHDRTFLTPHLIPPRANKDESRCDYRLPTMAGSFPLDRTKYNGSQSYTKSHHVLPDMTPMMPPLDPYH